MLMLATTSAPVPVLAPDLSSRIELVTLYPGNALVQRRAELAGSGDYVIPNLPVSLDPNNIRVRCENGEVVSVEPRLRLQLVESQERIEGLRREVLRLTRAIQAVEDERAVIEGMRKHLESLSKQESQAQQQDVRTGHSASAAWNESFDFLKNRLAQVMRESRDIAWKLEDLQSELAAATQRYELARSGCGMQVYDVHVTVQAAGASELTLEYFVAGTGWKPAYDLRARKGLDAVEMTYRAKIWQQTGEDWDGVQLVLSTARPQLGAQGPDPLACWIGIQEPVLRKNLGWVAPEAPAKAVVSGEQAVVAAAVAAPGPSRVVDEGLSTRYELRDKARIPSRAEASTVLVGTANLEISAERVCVPARDTTVWLRGKTRNTSSWMMLPGTATVFFGADFLGTAELEAVRTGQEFVLHLGADPAVTVERIQSEDQNRSSSFLSNKQSKVESWRIHLKNHGALSAQPDGSIEVIVREALPRSRDDRVEVEMTKAEPSVSNDARWKRDRDESGIQTWVLRVPRGDAGASILWQSKITYPEGSSLVKS